MEENKEIYRELNAEEFYYQINKFNSDAKSIVSRLDVLNGNCDDDEREEEEIFDKHYLDRYLSEELMPVMFGRLSNNARFIKHIGKKGADGTWELCASINGLRKKSQYDNRCRSMEIEDFAEVFQKPANYSVLVDWIKKNKPDKLKQIEQFKEAFKDFDKAWLKDDDERDSSRDRRKAAYWEMPLKKDILIFKVDDSDYEPKVFPCEKLVLRFSTHGYGDEWQFFLANKDWKQKKEKDDDEDDDTDNNYSSFIPNDSGLAMLPFRDIFPQMSEMLDGVANNKVPTGNNNGKLANWFSGFKMSLSAYTSLINL